MKKIYVFLLVFAGFFLGTQKSEAQSFVLDEGDIIVNAGIGLGHTFSWAGLGLPLGASLEYGIKENIGVGGDIGFVSGSGLTYLVIGAKGSYHFNELFKINDDTWDIYGGLGLYYQNYSFSGVTGTFSSGIHLGIHAGARYFFSDSFGVFAELGNTLGWAKVGVSFKF